MATSPFENPPATLVERYGAATGASDLTGFGGMIPKDGGTASADLLLAAGLADNKLGTVLMRLSAEWDGVAKPSSPGPRLLKALAGYIHGEDADAKELARRRGEPWKSPGSPEARAVERAGKWYAGELRLLAQSLKSKRDAVEKLNEWAAKVGIEPDVVAEAIHIWLDPMCPSCHGHGTRQIHGQPARLCLPCNGTGNRPRPELTDRVIRHMDYCVGVAKGGIKTRLA